MHCFYILANFHIFSKTCTYIWYFHLWSIFFNTFVLYLWGTSFSLGIRCIHNPTSAWLPNDLSLLPALFTSILFPLPSQQPNRTSRRLFLSYSAEWMHYFIGMPSLFWPTACNPYTHTSRHFSMQQIKKLFQCQADSNASLQKMNCKGYGSCSSFC